MILAYILEQRADAFELCRELENYNMLDFICSALHLFLLLLWTFSSFLGLFSDFVKLWYIVKNGI